MVGVTSVNLGGIEVDVEDVADRLRRLKVPPPHCTFFSDALGTRADAIERCFDAGGRIVVAVSIFGFRVCSYECLAACITYDYSAYFNA
jgi:hypothetical protein